MRRKNAHHDRACLSCAAGRALRLALGLPAVGCQRVVCGKHLGRGLALCLGHFWPDGLPVVRTEVFAGELSSALFLNSCAIWDRDSCGSPSIDSLARQLESSGETRLEPRSVKKYGPLVHRTRVWVSHTSHVKLNHTNFSSYPLQSLCS